ncbi:hypothetical protein ACIGHC_03300 [Staphylococcus saprophyticus]|uniref:hypothetical protein n=1 Tax=Staphylococcus saprophyticus TaxID=29385 RepID=UPI0037D07CEC
MVKIKQKKTMNLPQLIEWAWDNDVRGKMFPTDQNQEVGIYIATNRDFMMSNADYIKYSNTFTVEIEEEITEDTVLPKLVTKNINGDYNEWTDRSVKDFVLAHMEAIYIPNDDLSMTLIWRNGKLVE